MKPHSISKVGFDQGTYRNRIRHRYNPFCLGNNTYRIKSAFVEHRSNPRCILRRKGLLFDGNRNCFQNGRVLGFGLFGLNIIGKLDEGGGKKGGWRDRGAGCRHHLPLVTMCDCPCRFGSVFPFDAVLRPFQTSFAPNE